MAVAKRQERKGDGDRAGSLAEWRRQRLGLQGGQGGQNFHSVPQGGRCSENSMLVFESLATNSARVCGGERENNRPDNAWTTCKAVVLLLATGVARPQNKYPGHWSKSSVI